MADDVVVRLELALPEDPKEPTPEEIRRAAEALPRVRATGREIHATARALRNEDALTRVSADLGLLDEVERNGYAWAALSLPARKLLRALADLPAPSAPAGST